MAEKELVFIKELAAYYMDFLETDFHRRKKPKRSVHFRSADNLLVGLNLSRYPAFMQLAWKTISSGFTKNALAEIRRGAFRTALPTALLQAIKFEGDKITSEQMDELRARVGADIVQISNDNCDDYDQALTSAIEAVGARLQSDVLSPFMSHVREPLERLDLGDENAIATVEEELCGLIQEPARNKISEIVQKIIAGKPIETEKELGSLFQADATRSLIVEFFSNLGVGDLFLELYELERNKSILDKHEFYLYFCDIAYEGSKYPIFYIPFSTAVKEDKIGVEFGAQVYLNKRALEYIVQKENERSGKKGTLNCADGRIVYLAQQEEGFSEFISEAIGELNNFFRLDRSINLQDPALQVAKNTSVRVTNSCYIALFDNADEALLNDYEQVLELLQAGDASVLGEAFKTLIDDFVHRNPDSVELEVQDEWDASSVPDRLVYQSPVPLNSEQRQILVALKKDGCKYVTVDGPPGTGKSHTITAIVCDSVLNNQSVLVLSDKKEALDVVEEKIASTLNLVRTDKKFQNPILRLGSTGSTYAQILSPSVMNDISDRHRAMRQTHETVKKTIANSCAGLKEDIEAEAIGYKDIVLSDVMEWAALETRFEIDCPVDLEEVLAQADSVVDLEDLYSIALSMQKFGGLQSSESPILAALGFAEIDSVAALQGFFTAAASLEELLRRVEKTYPWAGDALCLVTSLPASDVDALSSFLQRYASLRKPLIGYMFSRRAVEALDQEFRTRFRFTPADAPQARLADIERVRNVAQALSSELERLATPIRGNGLELCRMLIVKPELRSFLGRLTELAPAVGRIRKILSKYPSTMARLGIRAADFATIGTNCLTAQTADDFGMLVRYVSIAQHLGRAFQMPDVNYADEQASVHQNVTLNMTYLMDGRVIKFYNEQRNTAKTLRDIIRSKKQFPQAEFLKLKDAFPCILAGIRDYAEYIPLIPEMFDLLIIDEASQVSIAQAFPALLRARKVLILGDKKQFGNVKAGQARGDTNKEYMSRLEGSFRRNVSRDEAKVAKLERFSIHTSILEFFEFITNYHAQLLKHSRSYKELISYSNTAFYNGKLQVMKIRGKDIDDVIRFTVLNDGTVAPPLGDGKDKPTGGGAPASQSLNINRQEVQFIISELLKLKEQKSKMSVGIITPHTDQQKLLVDAIGKLQEREYLYDELRLKIMTFDTCQGEERDLIFYSMVATVDSDKLWGVFIKDLKSINMEEDGKIKAQRLNVGFSRAKECVHFVLSKPLEGFNGAIGEALRHFWNARAEARTEHSVGEVDPQSGREAAVLDWFYQTRFWREEKARIKFTPQFELGKYLKQLDPEYTDPAYRVDFLLLYRSDANIEKKIIIEYDGFKEHFGEVEGVDASNYSDYYSEEDVYRQKVLESYGYKFLRINRFNLGIDPIATIDTRLRVLVGNRSASPRNDVLDAIHIKIKRLQDGDLKECPKCKKLRNAEDFKDDSLSTGAGRFCRFCKGLDPQTGVATTAAPRVVCPKCGARMVLRESQYGPFYGCSTYPACRGTVKQTQPEQGSVGRETCPPR